jgi:hypothetical protein
MQKLDGGLPKEFLILFICVAVVGFALAKDVLLLEASPCLLLGVGAYYYWEHREEQQFMDAATQRKLRRQAKKDGWELSVDSSPPSLSPRAKPSKAVPSNSSEKGGKKKTRNAAEKRTVDPKAKRSADVTGFSRGSKKKTLYGTPAGDKLFAGSGEKKSTGIQKKRGARVYAGRTKTRAKAESSSESSKKQA